uniref:Uncharacterized protein n=1 Tax=Arundo donax TaxID=35708 RepID=A0A0A8YZY2_ARUDO
MKTIGMLRSSSLRRLGLVSFT